MEELRILSVTGNLGLRLPRRVAQGSVSGNRHMIGADKGSSDPGHYYLGSGKPLTKSEQVRRDLSLSLAAARHLGVP